MNEINDPACIVKAFENTNISILQKDTEYFFKASDVASALEITNVCRTIQNFTDKERVLQKCHTLGGPQDVVFLTSRGVYRLLYSSKKKIAEQFRDWVGDILDDIIFNYSKKLKEQLEEKEKELKEKDTQLKEKERIIEEIENRPETIGFTKQEGYIYLINDNDKKGHYKIGMTNDLNKRVWSLNIGSSTHSLILSKHWKTNDKVASEKLCHYLLEPFKIKSRNEWFYVKNDDELAYMIESIEKCINFINSFPYTENEYIETLNKVNKNITLNTQNRSVSIALQQMKAKSGTCKGASFNKLEQKWESYLTYQGTMYRLGHHATEEDAGTAYNDFALYMNKTHGCQFTLNEIENYKPNPRNIPEENKLYKQSIKISKYKGVRFNKKKYDAHIVYKAKTFYLGRFDDEIDAAKAYNKQALYFNNNFNTKYELNIIDDFETKEENIIELNREKQKNKKQQQRSIYTGVNYSCLTGLWFARITYNNEIYNLGNFDNQIDAAKAYNEKAKELNKKLEQEKKKRRYQLNSII